MQDPKKVFSNEMVRQWIKDELHTCKQYIEELKQVTLDRTARIMVNFLVKPLEKFIDTY